MVHVIKSHFIKLWAKTHNFELFLKQYQLSLPFQNFFPIQTINELKRITPKKIIRNQFDTQTITAPKHPPFKGYNPLKLKHKHFDKPEGIHLKCFRQIKSSEILGNNASKMSKYKNPEYFSYHRYSQVDLFINGQELRQPEVEKQQKEVKNAPKLIAPVTENEDERNSEEKLIEKESPKTKKLE